MVLLQIPGWFPPCLVSKAKELYARELNLGREVDAALIERLVADPRMERVWQELSKRIRVEHKATNEPVHPVTPPDGFVSNPDTELRQRAFLELFVGTFVVVRHPNLPRARIPYSTRAERLRRDARTLVAERPQKEGAKAVKKLIAAAEEYERLARTSRPRDQILSITKDVVMLMKERFGSHLYRTAATLISVAVDQKVNVDFVRECCHPRTGRPSR
jgi:hypothetical protein